MTAPARDGAGRALLRRFRVGKGLLVLRHAADVGPGALLRAKRNESRLLPRVSGARPISVGSDSVSVHMLLNHARIYEGAWAIRSLLHYADRGMGVCIHDDGTLSEADCGLLRTLFPGVRIVARSAADEIVAGELTRRGLVGSVRFRRDLVLALKIFDSVVLGTSDYALVLDSDVLFFHHPGELLGMIEQGRNAYSVDFGFENAYCASFARRLRPDLRVTAVNSGVVLVRRNSISLEKIESYLLSPLLYENGQPNWFAEQALFGLALLEGGATPLSRRYAIVGRRLSIADADAVHFCASAPRRRLFYSHGLPYLSKEIGLG